ncbi:MAG: hypothetical protein HOU01_11750 [Streptomycetaceae bacterium]|nr:hypothetical protein [Streptomycetaceae bacterium]
MSGRGEPPDGRLGGGSDGEDEFRVVFDESFVRAAVLHEPTAQERIRTGRGPRRLRRIFGVPAGTFRVVAVAVVVVLVMTGALYFGARRGHPTSVRTSGGPAVLIRVSLVPGEGIAVSSGPYGTDPFAGTAAATWQDGRAGITLPDLAGTAHFSAPQVRETFELVRDFVSGTQLDPNVWRGARPTTALGAMESDQRDQLTAALDHPADDDLHAATGWVTRFDPALVSAVDTKARIMAVATASEPHTGELRFTVDGIVAYAIRGPDAPVWTRFVVHRVWEFAVDAAALRHSTLHVVRITTIAAPQACTPDTAAFFRPMSATAAPPSGTGTPNPGADPWRLGAATEATCGILGAAV